MIKPLKFFNPAGDKSRIGIYVQDVYLGFIERKTNGWWSIKLHIDLSRNLDVAVQKFRDPEDAKAHANKVFNAWVKSLIEEEKHD